MMEEERHIDLFERYRNNELSESQLRDFEARLSYDSDFKNTFEEYESVEEGIRNHFRNELKYKLQEVDKAMDETPKKHSSVRLIAWTSSVAAAIVIGVFVFQHFAKPNHIELAQNYWPHEEGLPVKMSDASQYDEAMNAFKLENWGKAESLLTAIDSDTSAYFLGEIAYRKGELPIAVSHFSRINRSCDYYHESQFKLSLIHLCLGDIKKAKEILDYLQKGDTDFSDEAKEILTRI